jgi:hypothetical protein
LVKTEKRGILEEDLRTFMREIREKFQTKAPEKIETHFLSSTL